MISFITGKPGGGKSFLATRIIIKELCTNPDRYIITNVPLKVERLISYCRAKYGVEVNPARIQLLTEEQCRVFFLHRAGGHVAPTPAEGTDGRIDYASCKGPDGAIRNGFELLPVMYIIDEAHLYFNSRDWAKTGRAAMFYLSQHRKMGDDVIFVTQSWKNVDAQFRRVTQEFTVCVNLAKRRAFGFNMPNVFTLRTFDSEPTPYALEVSTEMQRLDVDGLGMCYDTAAGVGIAGKAADTQQGKKGLPWQLGVVAACVLVALTVIVPLAIGDGTKAILGMKVKGNKPAGNSSTNSPSGTLTNAPAVTATNAPALSNAVPVLVNPPPPSAVQQWTPVQTSAGVMLSSNATGRVTVGKPIEPEKPARVKFFLRRGDVVIVGLDNGDTFAVGDGRLQVVGRLAVVDGNRAYRLPE